MKQQATIPDRPPLERHFKVSADAVDLDAQTLELAMKQQAAIPDRPPLERNFKVSADAVDLDARTLELAFSSEYPVERWFGTEVLGHAKGEADLERLNDGGAVLVNHDAAEHHGVVVDGSARVDADGIGRATIRLADDDAGQRILHRVRDGILRHASMRYEILKARLESEERRGDEVHRTYRATKWRPVEISLVPIPADPTVGVGRSLTQEDDSMAKGNGASELPLEGTEDKRSSSAAPSSEPTGGQDIELIREDVERKTNRRVDGILRIMDRYKGNRTVQIEGRRAIAEGMPVSEFGERVIFQFTSDELERPKATPPTELGLGRKEAQSYSMLRALRALVVAREKGVDFRSLAPFEADCSSEIAERLDREPAGIFVPFDVQSAGGWGITPQMRLDAFARGLTQMRAPPMSVGLTSTEGSDLVGTTHLASQFIEALRPATVVIQAGGRVLDGLVGNVDIPKQDGVGAFAWEAEDGDSNDTEVATAVVQLSPKTVSGSVPITRRLLKQSSPAVEAIVRSDLVMGAGEALDVAALAGTGATNQPLGIRGSTGINTQTVADASSPKLPTFAEFVGFETEVGSDNALRGTPVYLTTWPIAGGLKTTTVDAGSGRFVNEGGMGNGYPIIPTTQMPLDAVLFGDFSQCLIGMWGTIDVNVDRATKAASGGLVLRAFLDADIGVRHAEAFCKEA